MWKTCNVVMITTNEVSILMLSNDILHTNRIKHFNSSVNINQHLYIISNETPKQGEYVCSIRGIIGKFGEFENSYEIECKPIIATTNSLLMYYSNNGRVGYNLPLISQQFIKQYIKEYNKGNVITEVDVEWEEDKLIEDSTSIRLEDVLKVNPDNTINIKPIKNSFTKMDFINALHKVELKHNKNYSKLWEEIESNL